MFLKSVVVAAVFRASLASAAGKGGVAADKPQPGAVVAPASAAAAIPADESRGGGFSEESQEFWPLQNDWSGAPGVIGPVTSCGDAFLTGEGVKSTTPGLPTLERFEPELESFVKLNPDGLGSAMLARGIAYADITGDGNEGIVAAVIDPANQTATYSLFVRRREATCPLTFARFGEDWLNPTEVVDLPTDMACADADRDGKLDVVYKGSGRVRIFHNVGNQLAKWHKFDLTGFAYNGKLFCGDARGDGDVVIMTAFAVTEESPGGVGLILN